MKFTNVPKFTRYSEYRVNVGWSHVEACLSSYAMDFRVNLDPDFQRAHVWDQEKQIKYVEYVCKGGRSGKDIYFNCPAFRSGKLGDGDEMVIVDGKQRMEAVRKFLRNELPIFDGHYLRDFKDRLRIGVHEFIFHVNDLKTQKEILQWYVDINDGGVAHTKEEIEKVRDMIKLEK